MVTMGAMQGWQCPVCGRVLAPFMVECSCGGNPISNTTTSTTGTVNITIDGEQIYKAVANAQKNHDRKFSV